MGNKSCVLTSISKSGGIIEHFDTKLDTVSVRQCVTREGLRILINASQVLRSLEFIGALNILRFRLNSLLDIDEEGLFIFI